MKNALGSKIRAGLKIIDQPWFYPIVLLLVGLAAYGIIFTRPGFYWDDWTFIYYYKLHESAALSLHYLPSRPFTGWLYSTLFTFTKMTPIAWEFDALILRWLGILFIYFTLNAIWPSHVWQNKWVGALMFVYPGFLSQPASVGYSQHFSTFLLFACSLFLTVLALKHRKFFWLWMPLSIVLGVVQMFITEFFVALEIIRLPIIWFTLRSQQEKKKTALLKTFLYWLPFGIAVLVFIWWRIFYLPTTFPAEPNPVTLLRTILKAPLTGLNILIGMAYQDIWHVLVWVWTGIFSIANLNFIDSKIARIAWLMGIAAAVLFGLYVRRTSQDEKKAGDHSTGQMAILGGLAVLAGAFPVWATNVQIAGGKWSDRFTLGPMLGAVILVIFLLDGLLKTRNQKLVLFAILMAAAISTQISNTNKYRLDWGYQQNIYWQLFWRVPNLKPGTAIIGSGTFTDKSSYYDAGYIINLLYSNQFGANAQYDYLDIWHLPSRIYKPNMPLVDRMQGSNFEGNTSQAVGMYFNANNRSECVRILDPVYAGDPEFNGQVNNLIPLSNLNEITNDGSRVPDPDIFGTEPAHTWCYFFEKADLARQMQDWKTINQLGTQAGAAGLAASAGVEYLPFIEAFAQTAQWSKAYDLSLIALKATPGLEPVLCGNWNRFQQIPGGQGKDTYSAKAQEQFCPASSLK